MGGTGPEPPARVDQKVMPPRGLSRYCVLAAPCSPNPSLLSEPMRFLSLLAVASVTTPALADDTRPKTVYEMRIYTAAPGKLDALNARFKDHTMKLFEKHGITNVGYFVPLDNKDNKLIYFCRIRARRRARHRGRHSAPIRNGRRRRLRARKGADW